MVQPLAFGPRQFPSLKRWLIGLFEDIELVVNYVDQYEVDNLYCEQLSHFERLVVVLEDRRYFDHRGVDWLSVLRVLVKATVGRAKGGASTIEMQFIRRVTGRYERTISRKFREMVLAQLLGFHMSKSNILRSYLSCAYFGYGLRGAQSASRAAFGKPISALTSEEAALLAAMMVYPLPRSPSSAWKQKLRRRANYGIKLLRKFDQRLDKLKMA